MLFNPLFIQSMGQTDTTSPIKQSKLNSPSYLFSDIIKIIHENTIGEASITPTTGDLTSADVTTSSNTATDSSMEQLLTLSENNSGTENINISLSDLLKNLLISSNSDQVNGTKPTEVSNKKNTSMNTLTSSISKADIEKLLQSLAASLSQLNISANSIQQVTSGNSGSDTSNLDLSNLNTSSKGLSQSNNSVAEVIIDLSKNLQSTGTASDNTTNKSDVLKSLYTTLESLLSNSNSNVSEVNTSKSSSDNTKDDSTSDVVSPEVQQLAAALLNIYQNNNGLTINFNSGNDSITIEIPSGAASSNQTNNTDSGEVLNTNGQADISDKAGMQSGSVNTTGNTQQVSTNTTGNTQQNSTDTSANTQQVSINTSGNAQQSSINTSGNTEQTITESDVAIAAATVNKAKENFFTTTDYTTKTTNTKTQADGNSPIVSSNQTNFTNSENKSDIAEAAGLDVNDKVIIKVISRLNNTNSKDSNVVNLNKTQALNNELKDGKIASNNTASPETGTRITNNTPISRSEVKINDDNTSVNTTVPKETEITTKGANEIGSSTLGTALNTDDDAFVNTTIPKETEITTKSASEINSSILGDTLNTNDNKVKAVDNTEAKLSNDNEIKLSNLKGAENTDVNANPAPITKISARKIPDTPLKLKNDIKNSSNEVEQIADIQDTDINTAVPNFSSSLKDASKQSSVLDNQKENQINQTNSINLKQDNSSGSSTDNINSVNQTNNEDIAQAVNSKQGSSFSDQQQKKSSDGSKNSEVKSSDQISTDFSTKIADTVKDKILNQVSASDSPLKTIKITEITKEIADIIQQNNAKSVVLQIKPESLGKIKITIDVNNNAVNARVEVDTEAIKQIVQNNTTELRQALGLSGMQLSSLSVNLSGGEQKQFQSFSQKKKSGYQASDKRIEDNVSLASTKSMGYNTYEYLI